jgi:hypothetical protein
MDSYRSFSARARWFSSIVLIALSVTIAHANSADATAKERACTSMQGCNSFSQTVGIINANEPSGKEPPSSNAIAGYHESYVTDFNGSTLPIGWNTYLGAPGSDAGTEWSPSQVVVSGGLLQLNAAFDTSINEWITGGTSQGNVSATYGAYFVRSRITGSGPTIVELLWPSQGVWPPEVDFNETYGPTNTSMGTVHFGAGNFTDHRTITIDMTKWHTWGVVWTPTSITYVVDGYVWGAVTVPNEIPGVPMHLAIQQQTWCSANFACPTSPASAEVDWVAEYMSGTAPLSTSGTLSRHLSIDPSLPATRLSTVVGNAALQIAQSRSTLVYLNVAGLTSPQGRSEKISRRVSRLMALLSRDVTLDGAGPLSIHVRWSPPVRLRYRRISHVLVRISFG